MSRIREWLNKETTLTERIGGYVFLAVAFVVIVFAATLVGVK